MKKNQIRIIDIYNNVVNDKPIPAKIRYDMMKEGYKDFEYRHEETMIGYYECCGHSSLTLTECVPLHHLDDEVEITGEMIRPRLSWEEVRDS